MTFKSDVFSAVTTHNIYYIFGETLVHYNTYII